MSSHVLDLELQLMLTSVLGSLHDHQHHPHGPHRSIWGTYLKGKMLKKVCRPVRLVGLCPASGIDPYAHRGSLRPWRVLRCDL